MPLLPCPRRRCASVGRRTALIGCAVLALSTAVASQAAVPTGQAAGRPNIVVVVADDWGYSDVGAFGGEIATPTLDALASQGVRFANFHVSASCSPTRSMLLTGIDNHLNGVGNLIESMPREHRGRPGYAGSLSPGVVTVATRLQQAGYRTLASGKWNVGNEPHNRPHRRGFERSLVQGDTGSDNWDPHQRYLPLGPSVRWFEDGREATMPARFYSSAFFVDRAIDYLREGRDDPRPFFLYLGFQANHVPLQAPREFIDRYRGRYRAGWDALRAERRDRAAALGLVPAGTALAPQRTTRDWNTLDPEERRHQERVMEVYAGMAEAMDHHLGRLVAHLRETGRHDDTVFVFLSDNGPEGSDYAAARAWLLTQYSRRFERLGGPGAYALPGPSWASATASPLSGYKFFGTEGGLRVPLIVAGAPGARAGAIHHGFTHVLDIVPTLLELAEVSAGGGTQAPRDGSAPGALGAPGAANAARGPSPLPGRSLLPVLRDPSARVRSPDEPVGHELSGNAALYRGDLKLSRVMPPVGDGQWRLYDLSTDPGEAADLSAQRPEVVRSMRAEYERWAAAHGVLPMPQGYDPSRQVLVNSVLDYWLPTYRAPLLALLGLLAFGIAGALARPRRSTRSAA